MRTTKKKVTSKYLPRQAATLSQPKAKTYVEEPKRLPNSVVRNPHKVPARQWGKWSDRARKVFNSMFSYMNKNQLILNHPDLNPVSDDYWKTISWNAAWMAADHVDRKHWGDQAVGPYKPGAKPKNAPIVEVHESDGRIIPTSA